MNGRLTLSASVIVIGGLALGLVAGCASKSMSRMGSGDVVADRQRLMKLQGASWADIQAKAKAGNIEAIAVNAETLALTAQQIPGLFPEGSLTDKSKAKPEVWQKWAEFESAARTHQSSTITVLHFINECDRRKSYLERGYSSVFDYCVRKLKYSSSTAGRFQVSCLLSRRRNRAASFRPTSQ